MSDRSPKSSAHAPAPQVVADIGGTNTRLALADGDGLRAGSLHRYRNADYDSPEALLADFLHRSAVASLSGACLAVAGPVRDGATRMTNLRWHVRSDTIARQTGCSRVHLMNDLQAQGHALDTLEPGQTLTLLPGAASGRTRLVVGLGTGVNAAVAHRTCAGLIVPPSECGHVHLPATDPDERTLADWLARRDGIATVEAALSGRGLCAIHRVLGHGDTTPAALVDDLAANAPDARETGALYTRLLARFLGDLALIHLPHGGIWLTGGLARALAPHLLDLGLAAQFHAQGRGGVETRGIALHVIADDFAALTGCAAWLARQTA
ncbi:MAG: glucokinase Glk [Rhodobacteraceae bacterium HLUCCA12]|nr:MAG: glucokinase Glk [Rhodobacteraceae bacterium HLUCCA12]